MTERVDYLRGQGRGPKICSSACKIYCRGNKTHYSLWLTLRVIKLFGDTEILQFEKELQRIFLKCTKFLNRSRFRTSHYGGRAKATCFYRHKKSWREQVTFVFQHELFSFIGGASQDKKKQVLEEGIGLFLGSTCFTVQGCVIQDT